MLLALTVLKVFAFGVMIDVAFVLWTLGATRGSYIRAGTFSVLTSIPSVFGYIEIFDNRWMAIPWFFGLFIGTIVGIKIDELISKRSSQE